MTNEEEILSGLEYIRTINERLGKHLQRNINFLDTIGRYEIFQWAREHIDRQQANMSRVEMGDRVFDAELSITVGYSSIMNYLSYDELDKASIITLLDRIEKQRTILENK